MESQSSNKLHIAILPSPGMEHVIPLFELAKRLVIHHNIHVSFLVIPSRSSTAQNDLFGSSNVPSDLHVINLPAVDIRHVITDDMLTVTRICVTIREHLRSLPSVLKEINFPKALILDPFMTDAFEACEEFSIPVYCFYTAATNLLAFSLHLHLEGENADLPKPVHGPVDPTRNRKNEAYKWFLFHMRRLVKASGIILNTWEELEPVPLKALRENRFYKAVYPVGPLIKQVEPITESERSILSWLDKQPDESVVFITLENGGTLSSHQMTELTQGLERSQQRFVLVAQKPTGENIVSFFNDGNIDHDKVLEAYFPNGFIERTEGVGLVVREWPMQVSVLGHRAVGGFMLHRGWNSTLESITNGVPMIVWPLYTEHSTSTMSLAEEIHVAVKPRVDTGTGLVMREEIERVVRLVLEGQEGKNMRAKAKELQASAKKGFSIGGSSYESISRLIKEINKRI